MKKLTTGRYSVGKFVQTKKGDLKWFEIGGYASVRPFLYLDHFHIVDLFCTSTALLQPLYFDLFTSTRVLRPFVKSGLLIGRVHVEVQFWYSFKVGGSNYRKGRRYENGRSTENVEICFSKTLVPNAQLS